jgi:hypothetical protein
MNHEISSRELTAVEASRLKRSVRVGIKGWADDIVFFALVTGGLIIVGIVLAVAAVWTTTKLGFGGFGRFLAIGIFIVFALYGARAGVAFVQQSRRSRQLARRDINERKVEVIRVENARLVEQQEHNDEGPLYYFGIGGGKVLFLGGQWLYDSDVYGVDSEELPFPSSSFTVHRLASGPVLCIEPNGAKLAPEAILPRKALPAWLVEPFKRGFLGDSLILDGDYEELLGSSEAESRHS